MIALLPAERAVEDRALALLNPVCGVAVRNPERIPALTKQGVLRSAQINFRLKPAFVLWYRLEVLPAPGTNRLVVDTMCAVNPHSTAEFKSVFWNGIEQIARAHACDSIEGVTAQAGLARMYQRAGAEVCGVLFRKELA